MQEQIGIEVTIKQNPISKFLIGLCISAGEFLLNRFTDYRIGEFEWKKMPRIHLEAHFIKE